MSRKRIVIDIKGPKDHLEASAAFFKTMPGGYATSAPEGSSMEVSIEDPGEDTMPEGSSEASEEEVIEPEETELLDPGELTEEEKEEKEDEKKDHTKNIAIVVCLAIIIASIAITIWLVTRKEEEKDDEDEA